MARTIRFHLDENCPTALAEGLRRYGVDVTTTPEVNLLGAPDHEQLAFATANGRTLFTQDEDFLKIGAGAITHAGILYCHQQKHSLGELIRLIVLVWEVYEAEELHNRVEYL